MNQARIRLILFALSIATVGAVLGFLWLLNINQSAELKQIFLLYIAVLWGASVIAFGIFYYQGIIFTVSGNLARARIIRVMVSILIVVQIAFAFASYAYREMQFSFQAFDHARSLYGRLDWDAPAELLDKELEALPEEIDGLYILDAAGKTVYVNSLTLSDPASYSPLEQYVFPLREGSLGMHISRTYHARMIQRILLDLFTVLVVSLFLGFELILLIIQYIEGKIERPKEKSGSPCEGFSYIRQLSFLFYFASRMSMAFIPLLAGKLAESALSTGSGIAASIPQSAETLFTCASIFLTSEMIIKRGWKAPFLMGLVLVAAGTLLSAYAPALVVFAAARALVGLGYGFCWMTLRNLALFGRDPGERAHGFALFNAGLYAGRNCGSSLGSILAGILGFGPVLVIAALALVFCGIAILFLKNDRLPSAQNDGLVKPEPKAAEVPQIPASKSRGDIFQMFRFLLMLIVPSCIIVSYSSYYLPVYTLGIGGETADVGRAQLLYGLVIVYAGPKISRLFRRYFGNSLGINIFYNILLSAALTAAGIWGGFYVVTAGMLLMGAADSFGFGVQNDYFLSLPFISRLPPGRALSLLSFLKKLAEMLGPLSFALALSFPGRQGILVMGIACMALALLSRLFKANRQASVSA